LVNLTFTLIILLQYRMKAAMQIHQPQISITITIRRYCKISQSVDKQVKLLHMGKRNTVYPLCCIRKNIANNM
jgi:hypothetical protein